MLFRSTKMTVAKDVSVVPRTKVNANIIILISSIKSSADERSVQIGILRTEEFPSKANEMVGFEIASEAEVDNLICKS